MAYMSMHILFSFGLSSFNLHSCCRFQPFVRMKGVYPALSPRQQHQLIRAEMPAPVFGRAKRVTDPLHSYVTVRLRGDDQHRPTAGCTGSSGSGGEVADLSGFVHGFFFSGNESPDGGDEAQECDEGSSGDEEEGCAGLADGEVRRCCFYVIPTAGMVRDLVNPREASPAEGRFRRDLEANAAAAATRFAALRPNPASFRRAVMGSLRAIGYNGGICKSRWKSGGGGLVAGAYEYIDVLTSPTVASPQRRYIVDVEFAGEFEIARPTAEYGRLAVELPQVFVGRAEELRQLLRLLAEAAKRSLQSQAMHLPPWRKSRYVQAKWLGPYRRCIDPFFPTSSPSPPPLSSTAAAPAPPPACSRPGRVDVKCRCVGFDAASPRVE